MGLFLLILLAFGIFPVGAQQHSLLADYAFDSSFLPFSGICPTPTYLSQPTATALGGVTYAASKSGFGQALFVPLPGGTFVGLFCRSLIFDTQPNTNDRYYRFQIQGRGASPRPPIASPWPDGCK